MILENSDEIALTAQADIHRFVVKVMKPALVEFNPSSDVTGEFRDIGEFLDAARINTRNALCFELRRTFALTLGALFERQLRSWLSRKLPDEDIEKAEWPKLVGPTKSIDASIRKHPVMKELDELLLLANAVRHGKGRSAQKLSREQPQFWAHLHSAKTALDLVGNMRIADEHLARYASAIQWFWYLAGATRPISNSWT